MPDPVTRILPVFPDPLPEEDQRLYLMALMESIRNDPEKLRIAVKIECELKDALHDWQANKEFFWKYLVDIDGLGGLYPNATEIPANTPCIVYVKESLLPELKYKKYYREEHLFESKDGQWIDTVTDLPLEFNKEVVAFSFLPNCEVKL